MRARFFAVLLGVVAAFSTANVFSATIQSTGTGGNWNAGGSWVGGVVPVAADDVIIVAGATINATTSQTCASLRIEGILNHNTNNMTTTVSGNITFAGTGSIAGGDVTRNVNVGGNLASEPGHNGTIGGVNMTINGTTNMQGRITFNSATGSKTFIGNVTIANGGAFDFSQAANLVLAGTIDMSGTSSLGGNSTSTGTIVGVSSFTIQPGATATLGRFSITIVGLTQINGATTFNSSFGTKSFIGGITINATTVDFTAAASINVNNTLTINGACAIGATSTTATGVINTTSTLVVSPAASLNIGRVDISVGGTSTIDGSITLTNTTGAKTLTGAVAISAASSITFTAAETLAMLNNLNTTAGAVLGNAGTTGSITVGGNFIPGTGGSTFLSGLTLFATTGNWEVSGTAVVDASSNVNTITVGGNWNVTSSNPNPFVEGNSLVTFNGTALQTLTTTEVGGDTFHTLGFNNTSGLTPGVVATSHLHARNVTHTAGNVNMAGFDLIITGDASASTDTFTAGTLYSSVAGTDLTLTDPSNNKLVLFIATTIGSAAQPLAINVTAASIEFDGSDFFASGTALFTRTGPGDAFCSGGMVFSGNVSFTQATGGGRWIMQDVTPDTFLNTVTMTNNSPNLWIVDRATDGNEFRGNLIVNNTNSGGFVFGRDTGTGTTRSILFQGSVTANQSGSGSIVFGYSSATVQSHMTFEGDIMMSSTAGSAGAISFGEPTGGSVTLTSTARFNVAAGNLLGSGTVSLRRITQSGTSLTQTVVHSGTGILDIGQAAASGNIFNANVSFTAADLRIRANTFHGATNTFTQTGATGSNANNGGNTFNGASTFTNQGSKIWRLGASAADDFNANARFVRTGTGALEPAAINNSTFSGNISTVGTTTAISFGTSSGRVTFDGASAKSLEADTGFPPTFTSLTINGGNVTFNTPATVSTEVQFTSGIINTNATNFLTMSAGSAVAGTPSNTSHVDGPVRKVGNTLFTFPTGDNGFYRAIGISAPTTATHHFTAEFFRGSHPFTNAVDGTLITTSRCEYWTLAQSSPGSNVNVTLNWNTPDCTPPPYIGDPTGLRVGRWNGSMWVNAGGTAFTGDATAGSVTSTPALAAFGTFILASVTMSNPLPIELISFDAEQHEDFVNLYWSTATEINNDHFNVERSSDGFEFISIAEIAGAGSSTTQKDYAHQDMHPLTGVTYYRLRQTDFSGKATVSHVIKIQSYHITRLKVFPNPAHRATQVKLNRKLSFVVINAVGQIILTADETDTINTEQFSPGVYIIRSDDGLATKLVVEE